MEHKAQHLLALLLTLAFAVSAKPVDPARAIAVAGRYLPQTDLAATLAWDELYLVTPATGSGYVLVAADDCVVPVLAWSADGTFRLDSMPDHVAAWLDGYRRDIAAVVEAGIGPSDVVAALWEAPVAPKSGDVTVGPLLSTTWDQSPRYNSLCPSGSGGRAVTGCVATATAQVMKYWNHPGIGHGSHSYSLPAYGTLSADFETYYQWSSMPASLGWSTPSSQVSAVAQLMYHVGVAVEMNYGSGSSGAHVLANGNNESYACSENALKKYFRYNPRLHGIAKRNFSDHDWDSVIMLELQHRRPVLYVGYDASSGHAFVVDGYNTDHNATTGNRFFHVNWGWGGYNDGYYTLDYLAPGSGGTGGNPTYTFTLDNAALIGIEPAYNSQGTDVAVVAVESADSLHGSVSGSGTYTPYTDTVRVMALAAEGYRFAGWSSGSTINPAVFVTSGDYTDTAFFLPLGTDTLTYGSHLLLNAIRNGTDTTRWGIRLPAAVRQPQRSITAVQVYIYGSGRYFVDIHQGDTVSMATRLNAKYRYLSGQQWHTIELDSAVVVDDVRPLWVVFRNNGTEGVNAAAMSFYSGNSDGSWYRTGNRWYTRDSEGAYGSWMIRAIFAEREPQQFAVTLGTKYFLDTVEVDLPDGCTVGGQGLYDEHGTATVSAAASDGMHFWYWVSSYGDTIADNPYTFTVDYPIGLTAVYAPYDVGIGDVASPAMRVRTEGLTVSVDVPEGTGVSAYDMQGRQVAAGRRFRLPSAGVYVLRAGAAARKIVVMEN